MWERRTGSSPTRADNVPSRGKSAMPLPVERSGPGTLDCSVTISTSCGTPHHLRNISRLRFPERSRPELIGDGPFVPGDAAVVITAIILRSARVRMSDCRRSGGSTWQRLQNHSSSRVRGRTCCTLRDHPPDGHNSLSYSPPFAITALPPFLRRQGDQPSHIPA